VRVWRSARVEGGVVHATYRGSTGPLGGPQRSPEETEPRDGTVTFDLATGHASVEERRATEDPTDGERWPAEAAGLTLWPTSQGRGEPWRSGDRVVTLELRGRTAPYEMILRAWDAAGAALPEIKLLAASHPREAVPYPTTDGGHVVVVACAPNATSCQATVFEVAQGSRVGEVEVLPTVRDPMAVFGGKLYVLSDGPRVLRAFELPSGKERWKRAVREVPEPAPIAP
jgi:hypothetical protein